MTQRRPMWAFAVLAILVLRGCASPAPTAAPAAVVYFRNLSGTALMVGVSSGDTQSLAVLRPCGGEASLAVWPPPANYPFVSASATNDDTGAFDALVAQQPAGTIDPDTLGSVQFTGIVWSRGNIAFGDLPKWITFNAGTTDMSSTQPASTTPPHCDAWPPSD